MKIVHLLFPTLGTALLAGATALSGASISDYYNIENIATPAGLDVQVGGLDFLPDGRLVAAFHRGEIYTYTPATREWRLFADGLHEPLGVVAINNREIVVVQRPELTRITDTDADGVADVYATINDAFGMSGNYHEFAFGPARDADGNFYVALNVASNGAGIREEIRGEFRHFGLSREGFYGGWDGRKRSLAGRMYSAVPWRGWIVKVTPDGVLEPFASGFRSPNGLAFDADGNLWAPDNQGDWLGTSKLFHVEQGRFYGHPAGLVWTEGWNRGNPLDLEIVELDRMRTRPAVVFPQGSLANSPTQPVFDTTDGGFGPFAGQMIIGEMNQARLVRVMPEEVDGAMQGAAAPFYDQAGLNPGNNRMVFAPDDSLWIGQTHLSWAGGEGLQRMTWKGETPMDVLRMSLTRTGFDLTFTRPLDPAAATNLEHFDLEHLYFRYHEKYGSAEHERTPVVVRSAALSPDRRTVSLELDEVVPWRVYRLNLKGIVSADGHAVVNPMVVYTLNRLRGGNTPPPGPELHGDEK